MPPKRRNDNEEADERITRIRSEVRADVEDLDEEGAIQYLQNLVQKWGIDSDTRDFRSLVDRAFQNFGASLDGDIDIGETGQYGMRSVDENIQRSEMEAIALYTRLRVLGVLEEEDRVNKVVKVMEQIFYARKLVLSVYQAKVSVHSGSDNLPLEEDLDKRLGSWLLRFRWVDMEKTSNLQKLLLFLLDKAMEKGYRKAHERCYEPIFINGVNTHAWREVCSLEEFVYSSCAKELHFDTWMDLTSNPNNAKHAVEYLKNGTDYEFPPLVKQRGVFSFPNGVYDAPNDAWHPFSGPSLSEDIVACNFMDTEFDPHDGVSDWQDVPTPYFDSVMEYQSFPAEVKDWMYIFLGRLLYPVGEIENWQIIPFLKGAAGCHAKGTPILMHDGSVKAVEDVVVGDALMGDDNTPRLVRSLARGTDEMYRIVPKKGEPYVVNSQHVLCLRYSGHGTVRELSDGRYSVMAFDGRHARNLVFYNRKEAESVDKDRVHEMTVADYLSLPPSVQQRLMGYRGCAVDFASPQDPLCDPYALGYWLGDGHKNAACFTTADPEIVQVLSERLSPLRICQWSSTKYTYGISCTTRKGKGCNAFLTSLQAYGLINDKHIPESIKTGSREVRLQVLAGLLDSDGYLCDRSGTYFEITQKCERLMDDLVYICRSLGFTSYKKQCQKSCLVHGEKRVGTYYRVYIYGAGIEDIPTVLTRKQAQPRKRNTDALRYGFDRVEPAGQGEYYGFSVDGNRRYLMGDFTVTHNSGKSLIVMGVCKKFFADCDVGVLSNNTERTFGIGSFYDKYMFVAPEVKNDFRLEQCEFQSMVSGEAIQVAVKHKKAFTHEWKAAGILAGNEVPGFCDLSGSIQRRVVVFDFVRTVVHADMRLGDKLLQELPSIILKCNRAYLKAVHEFGSDNIWTVLPGYFKHTRDEMAQAVNSLEAFLGSAEVKIDSTAFYPFDDFKRALKAYELANGFPSRRYTSEFFNSPFQKFGITKQRDTRDWQGQRANKEWVVGCCIALEEEFTNDL